MTALFRDRRDWLRLVIGLLIGIAVGVLSGRGTGTTIDARQRRARRNVESTAQASPETPAVRRVTEDAASDTRNQLQQLTDEIERQGQEQQRRFDILQWQVQQVLDKH